MRLPTIFCRSHGSSLLFVFSETIKHEMSSMHHRPVSSTQKTRGAHQCAEGLGSLDQRVGDHFGSESKTRQWLGQWNYLLILDLRKRFPLLLPSWFGLPIFLHSFLLLFPKPKPRRYIPASLPPCSVPSVDWKQIGSSARTRKGRQGTDWVFLGIITQP